MHLVKIADSIPYIPLSDLMLANVLFLHLLIHKTWKLSLLESHYKLKVMVLYIYWKWWYKVMVLLMLIWAKMLESLYRKEMFALISAKYSAIRNIRPNFTPIWQGYIELDKCEIFVLMVPMQNFLIAEIIVKYLDFISGHYVLDRFRVKVKSNSSNMASADSKNNIRYLSWEERTAKILRRSTNLPGFWYRAQSWRWPLSPTGLWEKSFFKYVGIFKAIICLNFENVIT